MQNAGPPLHVMEFDYPSASFGANGLATGASFHYRVKIQGSGTVSLQYEAAAGHNHASTGPKVDLGDEGSLRAEVNQAGAVTWNANLIHSK